MSLDQCTNAHLIADTVELFQVPARDLHHTVVKAGLEASGGRVGGRAGDGIAQLGQ